MLHDLQQDFAAIALSNNKAALLGRVQAARGTPERRLGVYHTNTIVSLTDVLKAAFPVVARIVGDRFFLAMAKVFIEAHPPTQPTLFRYGHDLPTFLGAFPPAESMPYLAGVARLEWARIEAYFAEDCVPMDPTQLAEIAPEMLSQVSFSLHPALRLIDSAFPIFEIWAVNQADHDVIPGIDFGHAECGLVMRRDQTVVQRLLNEDAYQWLKSIATGLALGEATALVAVRSPNFDLQNTLHLLLAEGAFTDAHIVSKKN